MAHEKNGLPGLLDPLELFQAFFLKICVPDREDFVHEKDVAVGVDGDGKGEADLHAARVVLELLIDEALKLGEPYDVVELLVDLLPGEPKDGSVEVDVVTAGKLRIETDTELEEGRDHAVYLDLSLIRLIDTGEYLEKGRLAAAVPSDDTEEFPLLHLKGHVVERPEFLESLFLESGNERSSHRGHLFMRDTEGLGEILDPDSNVLFVHFSSVTYNLFQPSFPLRIFFS